ncbi:acyltransferase family protein [Duganella sp. FT50W]|uniref:Acyltransferase family protein n=1 Tax=Duganella lactea TaxID=2692173 RepID=A0A6L8MR00_9BURK|nr:acyltransferase [Duganella lactea]MYM83868.1 acyltransferase family protein [Duganella lactea]
MTRAPGLDLLRALAIAAVMLYHISSHGIPMPVFVEHGWMGVDLFFVLSGYLIGWQLLRAYAHGEAPHWRRFMLSRALRILPAYYAVLVLYVLLPSPEGGALQPLWKYLTFTLNFASDWRQGAAYSHAWSLCVEEHVYLLFPVAAWLLARRLNARRAIVLAVSLIGGGMLLRGWLWQAQVAPHLADDAGGAMRNFIGLIYNPTYARLDGLLMGVNLAACRAFRPAWWDALLGHGRALLAAGAITLAASTQIPLMSPTGAIVLFPLVALGCTMLLTGAISPATWIGRQTLPGVRTVAILAFSLYLIHKQIYAWLDTLLPDLGRQAPMLALVIYMAASLAAAALLYLAIERPGLRLRRQLTGH